MDIRIVTDSTSDLPDEASNEFQVSVVPLNVIFGDHIYRDGIDISADEFYRRLQQDRIQPTTSQPAPSTFVETYEGLFSDGADEIISIHISAKLSGTLHSAQIARDESERSDRIHLVDSKTVSLPLAMIAIRAAIEARAGSVARVIEMVRNAIERNNLFFMADTLEYVRRGGRIGRASALVGSVLQIKPILTMEDGEVAVAARPRTRSRALDEMLRLTLGRSKISQIGIAHTTSPEDAEKLRLGVHKQLPGVPIMMGRLGPVLGAHVGPGSLGICYFEGSPDGRGCGG